MGGPLVRLQAVAHWSLIFFFQIYSGEIPFANVADRFVTRIVVDRNQRPDCPPRPQGNGPLWRLLQSGWDADPKTRPTFAQIVNELKRLHPTPSGQSFFFLK
jgi:hypothetical protein